MCARTHTLTTQHTHTGQRDRLIQLPLWRAFPRHDSDARPLAPHSCGCVASFREKKKKQKKTRKESRGGGNQEGFQTPHQKTGSFSDKPPTPSQRRPARCSQCSRVKSRVQYCTTALGARSYRLAGLSLRFPRQPICLSLLSTKI